MGAAGSPYGGPPAQSGTTRLRWENTPRIGGNLKVSGNLQAEFPWSSREEPLSPSALYCLGLGLLPESSII
jgi:hypothetical protein